MKRDWDTTYRVKGVVQKNVLSSVRTAVERLKSAGCERVLDLCRGSGRHTLYLAKAGFDVYSVDVSLAGVFLTKRLLIENGSCTNNLTVGDMRRTGFSGAIFDAVPCVWSTRHGYRSDLEETIGEMFRLLKPSGSLLADFPNTDDPNFGNGTLIAENTFLHPFLNHSDVSHYYTSKDELKGMISMYSRVYSIEPIDYWCSKHGKTMKSFWVDAEKRT